MIGIKKRLGKILSSSGRHLQFMGNRLADRSAASQEIDARVRALQRFWFLADAPLYIDDGLVGGLFDAIFRPEFEASSRTISSTNMRQSEDSLELAIAADASVPTIFKVSATGKGGAKQVQSRTKGESIVEVAVASPARRLENVVNLYAYSYPDRALWAESDLTAVSDLRSAEQKFTWETVEALLDRPGLRPLIVLDLMEKTKLLPMFAELSDGSPKNLYEQFLDQLPPEKAATVPLYPKDGSDRYQERQQQYWSAFQDVFESSIAMRTVEATGKGDTPGRIDWIDYRLAGHLPTGRVIPIHLHLTPRGRYPAGTFAYQFIRRAHKFGVRVVGTLKKGYDINVLAIYER